ANSTREQRRTVQCARIANADAVDEAIVDARIGSNLKHSAEPSAIREYDGQPAFECFVGVEACVRRTRQTQFGIETTVPDKLSKCRCRITRRAAAAGLRCLHEHFRIEAESR